MWIQDQEKGASLAGASSRRIKTEEGSKKARDAHTYSVISSQETARDRKHIPYRPWCCRYYVTACTQHDPDNTFAQEAGFIRQEEAS